MFFEKKNFFLFLLNLFILFDNLNSYNGIFLYFRTKNLRLSFDDENYEYTKELSKKISSSSSFINRYYYNGINSFIQIGNPNQYLNVLYNLEHSNFLLGKCDKMKDSYTHIFTIQKFLNSKTLRIKEVNNKKNDIIYKLGNDHFQFYNNSKMRSFLYIEGINFLYNDTNISNNRLCSEIGLNANYYNTIDDIKDINFIEQLKSMKIISKRIWSLEYKTLSQGIVVFGLEPHVYDPNNYYYSSYKSIYVDLNKKTEKENFWSFSFDEIYINNTNINTSIYLKDREAELLIDHGLIIGTEEFKNIIEKIYFNKLINENICFKENVELNFGEISKQYIVYYFNKSKLGGNNINFPELYFYHKKMEYTFKMGKTLLFQTINERIYFLMVFEKNKINKIWKLGEPFILSYTFVFNFEQKTIGFYNPLLPKIRNSNSNLENKNDEKNKNEENDLIDDNDTKNKNNNDKFEKILSYIKNIIIIIILFLIMIYILEKIFIKRKLRANELIDNYEYLPNMNKNLDKQINTNSNINNI